MFLIFLSVDRMSFPAFSAQVAFLITFLHFFALKMVVTPPVVVHWYTSWRMHLTSLKFETWFWHLQSKLPSALHWLPLAHLTSCFLFPVRVDVFPSTSHRIVCLPPLLSIHVKVASGFSSSSSDLTEHWGWPHRSVLLFGSLHFFFTLLLVVVFSGAPKPCWVQFKNHFAYHSFHFHKTESKESRFRYSSPFWCKQQYQGCHRRWWRTRQSWGVSIHNQKAGPQ